MVDTPAQFLLSRLATDPLRRQLVFSEYLGNPKNPEKSQVHGGPSKEDPKRPILTRKKQVRSPETIGGSLGPILRVGWIFLA